MARASGGGGVQIVCTHYAWGGGTNGKDPLFFSLPSLISSLYKLCYETRICVSGRKKRIFNFWNYFLVPVNIIFVFISVFFIAKLACDYPAIGLIRDDTINYSTYEAVNISIIEGYNLPGKEKIFPIFVVNQIYL